MANATKTLSNGSKAAMKDTLKTPSKTRFIEFNYFTLDDFLKKFKRYIYNRGLEGGVDLNRAKAIARDITALNTFWLVNPIFVNKRTKTMVNGHHTLEALKILRDEYGIELEVPVCIIDIPAGISDAQAIQMFNNIGLPWKLLMYVLNYAKEGNKNYESLIEMCKNLPEGYFHKGEDLLIRNTSALSGKCQQENLRQGKYKLTSEDVKEQVAFGEVINRILVAAGSPKSGQWTESFIIAVHQLRETLGKAFAVDKLVNALENNQNNARNLFNGSTSTKYWRENLAPLAV